MENWFRDFRHCMQYIKTLYCMQWRNVEILVHSFTHYKRWNERRMWVGRAKTIAWKFKFVRALNRIETEAQVMKIHKPSMESKLRRSFSKHNSFELFCERIFENARFSTLSLAKETREIYFCDKLESSIKDA